MFSKSIFKQTMKSSYKLWLVFTGILCLFVFMQISKYDPSSAKGISLLELLGSQFYSMQAIILPMIYVIPTANSLIASKVDRGSMAYLLSTPTKRSKVVFTQAIYFVGSILALYLVMTCVGLIALNTKKVGIDFNLNTYLMLNLGCFLLMFAISSISFLFSCIFNLSKNALALGAGIPIAFFVFHMMANIGSSLEGFKYLSLNTLFDTKEITSGGSYAGQFAVLAVLGVVLYVVGMGVFKEKDLPL